MRPEQKFLKAASQHLQKRKQIVHARHQYEQQLQKIQRIPKPAPVTHALRDLERKVTHLLEVERKIVHYEVSNARHDEILRERIKQLEAKLDEFTKSAEFRSQRIKKLENRITQTLALPEQISKIKSGLNFPKV